MAKSKAETETESQVILSMERVPGEFFDRGRPPMNYDKDTGDAICMLVALGWSMRKIKAEGESATGFFIPSLNVVFRWLRENEEFNEQYARARDEQMEYFSEEIMDIADDGRNDWMEIYNNEGEQVGWKINGEATMRSKIRVDVRKWLMSKRLPKKYGDKLDLTSDGKRLTTAPLVVSEIKPRENNTNANAEIETEAGS